MVLKSMKCNLPRKEFDFWMKWVTVVFSWFYILTQDIWILFAIVLYFSKTEWEVLVHRMSCKVCLFYSGVHVSSTMYQTSFDFPLDLHSICEKEILLVDSVVDNHAMKWNNHKRI